MKSLANLKEAFKTEVGEHSWEEAVDKYPDYATEGNLTRFSKARKLEGPTLLAFQQFCRAAISSISQQQINTSSQLLSKVVDGQTFQCTHIKTAPERLTYGVVTETLPGIPGLSLVMCVFAGLSNAEVRCYI